MDRIEIDCRESVVKMKRWAARRWDSHVMTHDREQTERSRWPDRQARWPREAWDHFTKWHVTRAPAISYGRVAGRSINLTSIEILPSSKSLTAPIPTHGPAFPPPSFHPLNSFILFAHFSILVPFFFFHISFFSALPPFCFHFLSSASLFISPSLILRTFTFFLLFFFASCPSFSLSIMFSRILFLFPLFSLLPTFSCNSRKMHTTERTRKGKINFTGVKSNDRDMKLGEFHSLVSYNNFLPLTFLFLLPFLSPSFSLLLPLLPSHSRKLSIHSSSNIY